MRKKFCIKYLNLASIKIYRLAILSVLVISLVEMSLAQGPSVPILNLAKERGLSLIHI